MSNHGISAADAVSAQGLNSLRTESKEGVSFRSPVQQQLPGLKVIDIAGGGAPDLPLRTVPLSFLVAHLLLVVQPCGLSPKTSLADGVLAPYTWAGLLPPGDGPLWATLEQKMGDWVQVATQR